MNCVHLGAARRELVQCPTCLGMVKVKVFDCARRENCTIEKPVQMVGQEVACCKYCHLFVEKE